MQPRKYVVEKCIRSCSLNAQKLPGKMGELTHQWYEEGDTNYQIISKAAVLGLKLSHGGVARHRRNHLVPLDQVEDISLASTNGHKVSDLEVIESIISAGAGQLAVRGIKISPEMTLRAIEMKFKLTQGSAFEGFLSAIGAVNEEAVKEEEFADAREAQDALLGKDEQEQVAADVSGVG